MSGLVRADPTDRDAAGREIHNSDYPFDAMPDDAVPVAIEVRPGSERLPWDVFQHDRAMLSRCA